MEQIAQPEWITVEELGARWKMGRSSIYRMRKHKGVPFYRIGDAVRIKMADVMEYERQAEQAKE